MGIATEVAVVTGSARGIGKAIAKALVREGFFVIVADVRQALAAETAAAKGGHTLARTLDVTEASSVEALVGDVERTVGPISLWVNNAGIMPTGPFAEQDLAVSSAIIDVNYRGVVVCTRLVLPQMLNRGRGHIVNIASATAAHPIAGPAVYSGTQAAVIGFSRALRRDLRHTGVRVSVILPYLATTAMGAGIAAQPGFGRVTPEAVAARLLHAMRRGGLIHCVPGRLRLGVVLINALPLRLRDLVDDLLKTDRIGLGGDVSARAA
jgi:short-subunit dehydrogenase